MARSSRAMTSWKKRKRRRISPAPFFSPPWPGSTRPSRANAQISLVALDGRLKAAHGELLVVVSGNALGLVDLLILDRIFQHHAGAHLALEGALDFLPRRLG